MRVPQSNCTSTLFRIALAAGGREVYNPPACPHNLRVFAMTAGKEIGMSKTSPGEVTQLLVAWSNGDRSALDSLLPLVEAELHRLAHRYMSQERASHTLQTTALVNEAYLKLIHQRVNWQSRAHFFAIAAHIMRRILIDHARKHLGPQHGGGKTISLEDVAVISVERAAELVALDEALETLARIDGRKGRVVELRYFGGLSVQEIAEVLGVSTDTITRDWRRAKAFLRRELSLDREQ
jgi:RNA polymerase sigma-70 factor, ECF subfamily